MATDLCYNLHDDDQDPSCACDVCRDTFWEDCDVCRAIFWEDYEGWSADLMSKEPPEIDLNMLFDDDF